MTSQPTTRRIAAIERNSGYVWGVTDVATIEQAAATITAELDPGVYAFESCSRYDADVSFNLYEVDADLMIENGQDTATIAAVEASRYLGSVRRAEQDDDA